jgi:hypothetical protein
MQKFFLRILTATNTLNVIFSHHVAMHKCCNARGIDSCHFPLYDEGLKGYSDVFYINKYTLL